MIYVDLWLLISFPISMVLFIYMYIYKHIYIHSLQVSLNSMLQWRPIKVANKHSWTLAQFTNLCLQAAIRKPNQCLSSFTWLHSSPTDITFFHKYITVKHVIWNCEISRHWWRLQQDIAFQQIPCIAFDWSLGFATIVPILVFIKSWPSVQFHFNFMQFLLFEFVELNCVNVVTSPQTWRRDQRTPPMIRKGKFRLREYNWKTESNHIFYTYIDFKNIWIGLHRSHKHMHIKHSESVTFHQ